MCLTYGRRRALRKLKMAIRVSDRRLAARLDMFGRLNREEAMPGIEQSVIPAATGERTVRARTWSARDPRPASRPARRLPASTARCRSAPTAAPSTRTRLHLGDQLGQDRDADAEPDDGGPDGDRRSPVRDQREGLMNIRAPISGLDRPSRASRATWASWAVSGSLAPGVRAAGAVRVRAVSPVARSSPRARP